MTHYHDEDENELGGVAMTPLPELDPAALEAAHATYERYGQAGDLRTQRLSDGCMSAVIEAYLRAASSAAPVQAEPPENAIAWLLGCLHHANPTDDSQWHVRPGRHAEFSKAVWAVISSRALLPAVDAKARAVEGEGPILIALRALLHAVCGETGFANAVRVDSGKAYPWPALDEAEALAIEAIMEATDAKYR